LGVEIDRPTQTTELDWTHEDRLGSIVAITDANGNLKEAMGFDAWGSRRQPGGIVGVTPSTTQVTETTDDKGFTGQEMLDPLELVHLNGRVYDPLVGKFVSSDPHITDPLNGQNYNRYSYVLNNPTNFTDPTGFDEVLQVEMTGTPIVNPYTVCTGNGCAAFMQAAAQQAERRMAAAAAQRTGVQLLWRAAGLPETPWGAFIQLAIPNSLDGEVDLPVVMKDDIDFGIAKDDGNDEASALSSDKKSQASPGGQNNDDDDKKKAEKKSDQENKATKNRVKPRKSTLKKVTDKQPRNENGEMIDPNTGEPLKEGEIDLGHKPGQEWRVRKAMHETAGSTREEVIEQENDSDLYQWEDRASNRSHRYEQSN
jgi:RHS repeat-associated protein